MSRVSVHVFADNYACGVKQFLIVGSLFPRKLHIPHTTERYFAECEFIPGVDDFSYLAVVVSVRVKPVTERAKAFHAADGPSFSSGPVNGNPRIVCVAFFRSNFRC